MTTLSAADLVSMRLLVERLRMQSAARAIGGGWAPRLAAFVDAVETLIDKGGPTA
ncbi:MAG: hypothetical protein NVSMB19_18590 [Vulcanimicrobiaceae bacterium]